MHGQTVESVCAEEVVGIAYLGLLVSICLIPAMSVPPRQRTSKLGHPPRLRTLPPAPMSAYTRQLGM